MEVVFDNPFGKDFDWLEGRYTEIAKVAFSYLNIKENYEVDVSLVDDEAIQSINREYRKIDKVTDVISFAFLDDKDPRDQINDPNVPQMLGEIFISVPQAKRQAAEIGNSELRELRFLFVHGLLHLLGYDHMKKEDEEIMFPLQELILSKEEETWTKPN